MRTIIKFFSINWLKTLCFNFYYFDFFNAIHFPILIFRHTKVKNLGGKIVIKNGVRFGLLRIGNPFLGMQDGRYNRTVWDCRGTMEIEGLSYIGSGCRICIMPKAKLILGSNFEVTGESTIICRKKIEFGSQCLLSWEILVMDTDFHSIENKETPGKTINEDRAILIGDRVWIGCRTTILKGTEIAADSIIAAGSIIAGRLDKNNAIYAGQGKDVHLIKRNIQRIL